MKNFFTFIICFFPIFLVSTIINVPDDQLTIQAGINAATNTDTVLVEPGTYVENINYNGKNITVGSLFLTTHDTSYISSTIIDGNSSGLVVTFNNGENSTAVLCGVTLINGSANYGGGICCDNYSNPDIRNVTISGNSAIECGGGIYCYNSSPSLQNVTITRNLATEYGGGISCFANSSPSLQNVTIADNSAELGGNAIYCDNSSPSLLNSILWNDFPDEIYIFSGSVTATYSDIQGGWTGTGNIDSDPLFVDPGIGDYHLHVTSPCIDAGDPASPLDLDGTIADMGAYYFHQHFGPVWYVSTTGSDITGNGSEEYPFATIQRGINFSADTDTVLVEPGTYLENINYNGKNINVGSLFLTTQDTTYTASTIIDGNSSGSVVTFSNGEDSTAVLCGFTLINGYANDGGGILCDEYSNPDIRNVIISGNSAMDNGGGIACISYSSPNLQNVIISNNSVINNGYGAGIFCEEYSNPDIRNAIISGNSGSRGGGIACISYSSPNLKNVIISNNSVNHYGGGIICGINSSPSLQNVTITGNSAGFRGGGLDIVGASPSLQNVIISNNSSGERGGGIHFSSSSSSLINVTISGNSAIENGGGIYCSSDPVPNLQNVTIADNSAGDNGGAIYCINFVSSLSLLNSILWNDSPQEIYIASGSVTATYSDIQGGWTGTGNIDSDPLFNDAPNNDYSLSSLSACINGGDPTTTIGDVGEYDLAGNDRFFDSSIGAGDLNDVLNRIDMGAYEYSSESGTIPDGTMLSENQVINSDLYIPKHLTCTISAGITYEFEQDHGMNIGGDLDAIGVFESLITFTASDTLSGWSGLNFISSRSALSSSNLEFCVIEYGDETGNGGNIYLDEYDELNITNCRITNGEAIFGGGVYSHNSKLNIINCVLNNNQSTLSGGAIFAHHSESSLINLTIADNIAGTEGGGLAFSDESYSQPEIMNCIIWDNGVAPIIPGSGALTNISYCDLEFTYPGSNNVSFDPAFTGEMDHPYNIENYSFCLNSGIPDTTGLNLPVIDILGNLRVFGHTNAFYDRIDIGAYEYQGLHAPSNFTASDGDNNYPGYVQLFWDYNPNYEPETENFRIFRDSIIIDITDPQIYSYSDYTALPGQVYSYYVQVYSGDQTMNSQEDSGYLKPNGIITGTVLSANNNPVQGVKISLDPSPGYCLEFDSSNPSSLTIEDPEVNMDYNFTIEFWVKTALSDVVLLNKGDHNFSVNASGKVEYTDGTNTITQDSLSLSDNEWHHLAVVNDYTNSRTFLYFDEYIVASDTSYTFSGSSDAGFSTSASFSGFLDEIKIWNTARDSTDIVEGMNIITAWDEAGLAGYWTLNEGTGNTVFDATNFAHNGTFTDCTWSTDEPGVLLGAFTNEWGEYLVSQIYYGASTTFTVTPSKPGHVFQPEQRQVTLSASNIAQNDIDFTDNSLIPISGYVKYQSTECPVVGATILLNGSPSLPISLTDEDGYYVMEVEHGTECTISVDYSDHIFNREWDLGEVTSPQVDINFEDTFKTQFRCEVVGGDDSYPIGEFDVTLQSVNGCYLDEITGENWSSGGIMINNIPPLDYNVTVDPTEFDPFNLAIDEQFQNMNTDLISLTNPDSLLDTLRFVWKADLEIGVTWPDTLALQHFLEYPSSEFYVLPQNEWCEIEIQAFEDYSYDGHPNQITYLNDCDLEITDEVGTKGVVETTFQDTNVYVYTFAPYLPNILSGYDRQYQNMLEVTVQDTDLNRFATQTDWVLTEGVRPLESTYATTSPEIPVMIIHDPPGDGSSSTFGQSSSHSVAYGTSVCIDDELNTFMNIHLGPDITVSAGCSFFSVETEIDITADFDLGLTLQKTQTRSMEQELTFTTSSQYSTSEDDQIIGDGADVFVGGAMNLIWGVTNEISWDDSFQTVVIDTSLMVTPDGFATVYIYTDNQIRNTVIPNLETIGDTTSVALWNTFLDNNELNKANALPNPNHPDNLSFNAGAGYAYEEETSTTESVTIEFESTVSSEFGALIGTTVNGVGGEAGYTFRSAFTLGTSENSSFETTSQTSFILGDDDEISALNYLADYFTIDVKVDPVYGTPVFDLVSGSSSCPWEPNTIPREGVSLQANTYTASGLLEGEEAAFILQLGNTSQTNEDRRYFITVLQGTNPGGANVKINGVLLENEMAFDVPAGETVQAIMTVAQGPFAYEYEDLSIDFYSQCDRGNAGPEGHYFNVSRSFDIYWEAPYSRITIGSPSDDWIINQAKNDTMTVMLTDYELDKPDFRSIKLQYKHPQDENWLPAFEVFRDSLLSHPLYIEVPWDVSGISDGFYEIRAATTDSVQANYYTDALSGVIDRNSPEVLGYPEPADGILESGDAISLSFVEEIDPNAINPSDVSLTITRTSQAVDVDIDCYQNTVTIIPNIANCWLENETLEAEVSGLRDIYGNPMEGSISWEFYVNANPVKWNIAKLDVIKPLGESMTLTANLENNGGQYYSYVFTDYADSLYHPLLQYHSPEWLLITPISGQLIPLDTQEIQFEISDQIGFGNYETIIYAHTSMGNEAIEIEVDVLSNPPDWSITQFNNFQSSMSVIGELNIEGELSVDTNDIIGAFMQEESGDWICRGVANLEAVPYVPTHPYQVFLTIYSDLDDSTRAEDEIRFRVWDNSENKEYYQIDHSVFGGTLMYLANSVIGTPLAPIILETVGDLIQDIPLVQGWTWFSTNLTLAPDSTNNVLSSLTPVDDDIIKNQQLYAQYFIDQWLGSLTTMNNVSMYKIKMANAQSLGIIGELIDPFTTTISYSTGWNWIGYIPHVSMSVNYAMENRANQPGDFIKNQEGYAFYVDSDIGWIGSLLFMNPGEGFMLQSVDAGDFEYPDYDSRNLDNFPECIPIVLRDAPDWTVNPQNFEYTANLTIELQVNSSPAASGNYMIGAFVGEECRGSATPIEVLNTWLYFLTVYSNTQNEEIDLMVYDSFADEIVDPDTSFQFMNDLIIGSPSSPYLLYITGSLNVPQNLTIEIIGTDVHLSWDAVTYANSYKVYSSDNPITGFSEDSSGTFDGTTWSTSTINEKRFYYVRAVKDEIRRNGSFRIKK